MYSIFSLNYATLKFEIPGNYIVGGGNGNKEFSLNLEGNYNCF
jgi:hypothetical protein